MRLLIALLFLPAFASCDGFWDQTAYAGGCYSQAAVQPYYVKQVVQPVYQNVQYLVGYPVRIDAMVQAELKASPEYAELRNYQQFKSEFEAFLEFKKQQESGVPTGALPQRQSIVDQRCIRCHSGPEPKGGYDFSVPLTSDALKAIKQILPTGKMPPPNSPEAKGFTNELAGQLILEAIDQLETDDVTNPPLQSQPLTEPQPPAEPLDHVPPPPPLPPE